MSEKWKRILFGGIGAIVIALLLAMGVTGAFHLQKKEQQDSLRAKSEDLKKEAKEHYETGYHSSEDPGETMIQGQDKGKGQGQDLSQGQGQGQGQDQSQEQGQSPGNDGNERESDEEINGPEENWDSYLEQQVQEGIQSIAQSGAEVPNETQMRWATEDLYNPIDLGPLPEVEPQWVYCNSRAVNSVQQEEKAYIDQIVNEMVQGLRTPEETETVVAAYLEAQGVPERLEYFYGVRAYGKDQFLLRNLERASVRGQEWMDTDFNYIYYALYTEGEYDEFGQLYFYDWQVSF